MEIQNIESLFGGLTLGGRASLVTKLVEKVQLPQSRVDEAISFYAGAKRWGEAAYVAEASGRPDIGAQMRAKAFASDERGGEKKLTPLEQARQSMERAERAGDFGAAQTAAQSMPELQGPAANYARIIEVLKRLWPNQYASDGGGDEK